VRPQVRSFAPLCAFTWLLGVSSPVAFAAPGSATMHWTAPGGDSLIGRAVAYDVRYSLSPITASNFTFATQVAGVPAPKTAGSAETLSVTNLVAGSGYYFAIKTADAAANWSGISNVLYTTPRTASVRVPLALWLSPPYPNPARAVTHWAFTLPEAGPVEIVVFDLAGRRIRAIETAWAEAGQGEASWDLRDDNGRAAGPGVYMVRATLGGQTSVKRLVVTH
jgi:hypothetical protein